ncbi:hypothetical protein BCV71DRAFT_265135 [Rhizopus microsporus]|uniref:Uncharacterized protein n=1 Tax=Rhizopus microsporus TaxID=58291 RepID=A0A1X0RYF6_RHIZD|nr:hypothetical protein BCV71DRAFT_265135 [Rhizopus microsporus]
MVQTCTIGSKSDLYAGQYSKSLIWWASFHKRIKLPKTGISRKWKPAKFQMEREKVPLVVFGAEMFGKDLRKLKGNRRGVSGVFWRALKGRETAGDLIVVTIDEHKASKVCNACSNYPLTRTCELKGCSALVCSTCTILWQRDVNACKNMLSISLSIWDGRGRPSKYRRN